MEFPDPAFFIRRAKQNSAEFFQFLSALVTNRFNSHTQLTQLRHFLDISKLIINDFVLFD